MQVAPLHGEAYTQQNTCCLRLWVRCGHTAHRHAPVGMLASSTRQGDGGSFHRGTPSSGTTRTGTSMVRGHRSPPAPTDPCAGVLVDSASDALGPAAMAACTSGTSPPAAANVRHQRRHSPPAAMLTATSLIPPPSGATAPSASTALAPTAKRSEANARTGGPDAGRSGHLLCRPAVENLLLCPTTHPSAADHLRLHRLQLCGAGGAGAKASTARIRHGHRQRAIPLIVRVRSTPATTSNTHCRVPDHSGLTALVCSPQRVNTPVHRRRAAPESARRRPHSVREAAAAPTLYAPNGGAATVGVHRPRPRPGHWAQGLQCHTPPARH